MNIPIKSLVVATGLTLALGLAPVASAQTLQEQRAELKQQVQATKQQFQETKAQVKANVDAAVEQRCSLSTARCVA
jgi:predicted  nucleic acid-binding Zn-ribbon protein